MNTSTSSVTVKLLIIYNLIFAFCWLSEANAQNIGINGTGANAHPSALLDLDSSPTNNTGFLKTRLTTAQRIAIVSPADGLEVYDTNLGGTYRYSTINNKWDCAQNPAGTVQHFANTVAPLGYLACTGQTVSVTQYPELFTAIGFTYGGSGSTFNVPDLRGEFIRGLDAGRGVDPARVIGSAQTDDFKSHTHNLPVNLAIVFGPTFFLMNGDGTLGGTTNSASTSATGGTETRPRNIALLPCIKY